MRPVVQLNFKYSSDVFFLFSVLANELTDIRGRRPLQLNLTHFLLASHNRRFTSNIAYKLTALQ